MVNRMDKINELVKHELSREILLRFPNEIVSVTAVDVSRDLSYAKVWISALENVEDVVKRCRAEASELTRVLARKLVIKKVPKLSFYADNTPDRVEKIEHLIDEIHQDEA